MKYPKLKFITLISAVFLTVFVLSSCSTRNEWTGFYYPNIDKINDKKTWKIQSGLESLEECREWVDNIYENGDNYDYECGYKCKYDGGIGFPVCRETEE